MKNKENYIGVVTVADPSNKMSWSGLNYKILTAIKDNFENVVTLGPLKGYGVNKVLALLNKIGFLIFKKRYNYTHSYLLSLIYSAQLNTKLKKISKCDTLIFIGSSSALSFLKFNGKIIYLTDATVNSLIDYYFFDLWKFSINESNYIEQKAIDNSNAIFFSSEWAKIDTERFYSIKHADRHVIKFGPNLNELYLPQQNIIRDVGVNLPFNLLFVGVDWNRKGGDVLLENYLSLFNKGYTNISLTICGCIPPTKIDLSSKNVKIYPYLNKNKLEDLKLLQDIFRSSHLFVLPTKAECSAVVFAEAAAYSLPILTFNTGGTASYIENSVNGYTIQPDDNFAFADRILELMLNQDLYLKFSGASFKKYSEEMNWNSYSDKIRFFIENGYKLN